MFEHFETKKLIILDKEHCYLFLTNHGYKPIIDQNDNEWLCHFSTGNVIRWSETEDCLVKSVAHKKESKAKGKYWFVSNDLDFYHIFDIVILYNGNLYSLKKITDIHKEKEFDELLGKFNTQGN